MYALLALLPILTVLVLMTKFNVPSHFAMLISLFISMLIGWSLWGMSISAVFGVSLLGVLKSLDIILIIYGAILLLDILKQSGALESIKGSFSKISGDRRIQLIVIAWFFSGFIEGAAGFGAAAALSAPLLAGLGFPAVTAVAVSLICNTMPVIFGAAGIPALTLTPALSGDLAKNGVSAAEFVQQVVINGAGIFAISGTFIPLIAIGFMLFTSPGKTGDKLRSLAEIVPFALLSGIFFTVPWYLSARYLGPELPSMLGVIAGLPLLLAAIKAGLLVPSRVWDFPGAAATVPPSEAAAVKLPVWKAWLPYLSIALLLVLTRLEQLPFKAVLNSFGKISIAKLPLLANTGFNWAVLNNPGIFPFLLIAIVSGLCFKVRAGALPGICRDAAKQVLPASIAIAASVAMVQIMVYSDVNRNDLPGMLTVIAEACAALMGRAYPLASPFIGVFGTFFAGSCTVSNILFASIQYNTAELLKLPAEVIVALQLVGGGIGSMIRISGVVAACATVNAAGNEGKLILRGLIPAAILTLLAIITAKLFFL